MRRTSASGSLPASDWSAVRTPSRSTVTQSQSSSTSFKRCEM